MAIDRYALVSRHNPQIDDSGGLDTASLLQVGNGEFAMALDPTGLQTLAGNTMAQWGWHSDPMPAGLDPEQYRLEYYTNDGRAIGYPTGGKSQPELHGYLRENPHRLNLGRLRFLLDGVPLEREQISDVHQSLILWEGCAVSRYKLAGHDVEVTTCCHPRLDMPAVRVHSPLIGSARLRVELAFPYGNSGVSGADWEQPGAHTTILQNMSGNQAAWRRELDNDRYHVVLAWPDGGELQRIHEHAYVLSPARSENVLVFSCLFSQNPLTDPLPSYAETREASRTHWQHFWETGGAIDLSDSRDERWLELERRIVLSQYLLAVNEAGSLPPQESGLYNSSGWHGKFHLEMHWWHGAHYALWNRWPLFAKSLDWYHKILDKARETAKRQGYSGARWPKMIGPEGRESPSGTGPLLIWQQAHPIFYAELEYRLSPNKKTLDKWQEIVFATADFMTSFPVWDDERKRYILAPPLKTAPENTSQDQSLNPIFELSYWRTGLRLAQQWRKRLDLPASHQWEQVSAKLASLPADSGRYLSQEGMLDTYTRWNWEHPSLIGIRGMLPGDGVDARLMRTTVKDVFQSWQWDKCWGWDFPMMAMAAARNGFPEIAVESLLHTSPRNQFDQMGLSSGGPFPYFPSNGGLLYAVALMAAGWDGGPDGNAPGFPPSGKWTVRWEALNKAI
jgi:hypothetical protein